MNENKKLIDYATPEVAETIKQFNENLKSILKPFHDQINEVESVDFDYAKNYIQEITNLINNCSVPDHLTKTNIVEEVKKITINVSNSK